MAEFNINSENIDRYRDFDFSQLDNEEITISEQNDGRFPLVTINNVNGILIVEVFHEVYRWDYWIRNYSVRKFEKAFNDPSKEVEIEGVMGVEYVVFEEDEDKILLTWRLTLGEAGFHRELKTIILRSIEQILFQTRLLLLEPETPRGLKKYFLVNGSAYTIGSGIFWVALPVICGAMFSLGRIKFDSEKNILYDEKRSLMDSITVKNRTIKYIKHNSDSALNILSHMPYDQMKLDTTSFRKVQTNIENAGAALSLNR